MKKTFFKDEKNIFLKMKKIKNKYFSSKMIIQIYIAFNLKLLFFHLLFTAVNKNFKMFYNMIGPAVT